MHIKNKKICEVLIAGLKVEQGTNAQHSPDSSGTLFCVGNMWLTPERWLTHASTKKSKTNSRILKLMV